MTVGDLDRRMTTREFVEWAEFYRVEADERRRAEEKAQRAAKARSWRSGRRR